jgi:hypothetical protein
VTSRKLIDYFDLISHKIIVSRDVIFEENQSWDWEVCYKEAIVADLEWETNEGESTDVGDNEEESEATSTEESEGNEETDHDVEMDHGVAQDDSPHEETDETSPHAARPRRPPVWMQDYESGQGLSEEEASNIAYLALSVNSDPIFFEDAVKNVK